MFSCLSPIFLCDFDTLSPICYTLCMELLAQALPWVQIVIAVLLSTLILLQRSGAELGGAFGGGDGGGGAAYSRRGFEKVMFTSTIALAMLFILANFGVLLLPAVA